MINFNKIKIMYYLIFSKNFWKKMGKIIKSMNGREEPYLERMLERDGEIIPIYQEITMRVEI